MLPLPGLKDVPGHFANQQERDELGKMLQIRRMTDLMNDQTAEHIHTTLSIFCVNYLPALVEKFLEPPPSPHLSQDFQDELRLTNAYFQMIYYIRSALCPYWMKYIRSHKEAASGNQVLVRGIVQRLVKVVPIWERLGYLKKAPEHWLVSNPGDTDAPPSRVLCLLQNIMTNYIKRNDQEEILPVELRKGLEWHIAKWNDWHEGTPLADSCKPFVFLLTDEGKGWAKLARTMLHGMLAGWHRCAFPGCAKGEQHSLKACGRCQSIKYCSPEHQKLHWKKHKSRCFETPY